MTRLKVKL